MEDADGTAIGRDEDLLAVATERESGPLTDTTKPGLKGCKGTLLNREKNVVIENYLRIDSLKRYKKNLHLNCNQSLILTVTNI